MLRFLVCVCGSYMDVVRSPLANVFGLTLGPVLPRHFQDWHSSAQNIDSQRNANVHGKVGRATRRRDIVSRPRLLNLLGIIEVARILHRRRVSPPVFAARAAQGFEEIKNPERSPLLAVDTS